ncbi:Linear gramicidin synthase subunit D [Streptomyces sp. RB5]|uniref:Linear gramicidin synthase subunit D n=1 Tax=Streptomyces smaragdinus TaxID=2585196 RepID=A0A7K0CBF5_9ACTN|nr:non-ribosomal peptide synthetase [Streptomyces smaragdinus]MQY10736.1 Linear gramicidin synthase subunit D [Streptomyces smaragdinus]
MADAEYPLTPVQERMWFLHRIDPDDTSENLATVRTLHGPLDADALARALHAVAGRHEPLRTCFAESGEDGTPVQRVTALGPELVRHEVRDRQEALRLAGERGAEPYRLETAPLVRAELYRVAQDEHVLLLGAHHLVSDGWSIQLLLAELGRFYADFAAGTTPDPEPVEAGFGDHVMWRRSRLEGPEADGALAHWTAELADPPGPGLPPGPAPLEAGAGAPARTRVDAATADAVAALAQEHGCTPFMAWLALFQLLVGRHTGQEDVIVGSAFAGRERPVDEALVGCFTAVLPLRADLGGEVSFAGLLARTRRTVTGALTYPQVPYERLLSDLGSARDQGQRQLFRHWFNLHTESAADGIGEFAPGLRIGSVPSDPPPTPFDLSLDGWFRDGGLDLVLVRDPALLAAGDAQALLDRLPVLARAAVAEPDTPVDRLSLLGPDETGALLYESGGETETVVAGLLRQAAATPDAPAVEDEAAGVVLSYRELCAAAGRVAELLRAAGAVPGTPVGVVGGRSARTLTGIFGALFAGCAYLPLDPEHPVERLAAMVRRAEATALLVSGDGPVVPGGLPTVVMTELPADAGEVPGVPGVRPEDPAYVLYTSGSTGVPKAVTVPHRALAVRTGWMRRAYGLGPGERVLQFAALGFDAHVEEIFPALCSGATVVLPPVPSAELPDWLAGGRITVLDLPTAYWQELVAAGDTVVWPAGLRVVIIGGDQVYARSVAAWRERFGDGVELWNTYGPTEACVIATAVRLGPADARRRPGIGRPVAATGAYVLDAGRGPVPAGVPGELWLAGDGLADGYAGSRELTAERFTGDPFRAGGRMYRTGDLARLRADGTLEFLGRTDRQLKVRGHRVEPAEVEAALLADAGVAEAVVGLYDDAGRQSLAAWVVPAAGASLAGEEVRRRLRGLLPGHLVPSAVVMLGRLPLTTHGKVDRAALPAPGPAADAAPRVEPRTDAELLVAEVWQEVLGAGPVGVTEDFFALGGHSLLALRVVARLRSALGVDVPVRALFDAPTVAGVAAVVEDLLLADIAALSDDEVRRMLEEGDPAA